MRCFNRAEFSLSRALFRKKCVGPSTGAADPIFPGKKLATHFLVVTVCQSVCLPAAVLQCHPHLFSPKNNWRPFLVITVAFIHFTRSLGCGHVAHYFRHVAMLQKICRSSCGASFCEAPVRPNMLNMPKSAAVL